MGTSGVPTRHHRRVELQCDLAEHKVSQPHLGWFDSMFVFKTIRMHESYQKSNKLFKQQSTLTEDLALSKDCQRASD